MRLKQQQTLLKKTRNTKTTQQNKLPLKSTKIVF